MSARTETYQKIEGLDAGADDYLPKPFETGELLARVARRVIDVEDGKDGGTVENFYMY